MHSLSDLHYSYDFAILVPGKIEKITVLNPGNLNTVLVVWDPPAVPNGVITGYLLNVSTSSSTVYIINPRDNTRTVSNLSKKHCFRVKFLSLRS